MAGTIAESTRQMPVYDEVDVLVCGGGPAGFSAALAAARAGVETLLSEQTNCLGGIATTGNTITFACYRIPSDFSGL